MLLKIIDNHFIFNCWICQHFTGFLRNERYSIQSRSKGAKLTLTSTISFVTNCLKFGAVAQLGERMTGSHEVRGSIPLSSTTQ